MSVRTRRPAETVVAEPGAGQFVKRARFGEELLAAPAAAV